MEAMSPWDQALDLLSRFITPAWDTLLQYIPLLLLFGLLPLSFLGIAWAWRRNAALNRSRVPTPLPAGPVPAGVHMPSPSIWPFIAPIGLALLFLSLAIGGGDSNLPVNLPLAAIGAVVALVAAAGWYRDATREYDDLDHPGLPMAQVAAGGPASDAIPEGIHLPGPSAWPFLAPIGLVFMFLGLALGPLLIVGGGFMAIAAGIGWFVDANREFDQVEATNHPAEPVTRDPVKVFPTWAAPTFAAVGGFVVLLTLAPWFLSLIPEQSAGGDAGPPPTTTPFLSASAATHFDQGRIVIPADTPVTLTFQNDQDGVPHDVAIGTPPDDWTFKGETITGVATIEYQLPPFPAGEYTFQCTIHPPMTGTVLVREAPPSGG